MLMPESAARSAGNITLRWSPTQNFRYLLFFLNIHKANPNTDHNIICMFLKRKTISKPEKSSLSYTNHGKPTILPRANNGIQLVYPIVCNFNGIVLFNSSNICVKSIILKSVSHTSKNSSESNITSIRLKFLVLIYHCHAGLGREPKKTYTN